MAHSLKFRELRKRLRGYGIFPLKKRGKGSEVVFLKPIEPGSKQGPIFTVKHHSDDDDISATVIKAILRRFDLDESEFFNPKKSN
jgi:hypothetical protein